MTNNNTISILSRAQEILLQRGWSREKLQNPTGEVCLAGAIAHAIGVTSRNGYDIQEDLFENELDEVPEFKACHTALDATLSDSYSYPDFEPAEDYGWAFADFNDNAASTLADVIGLLDETKACLQAGYC